MANINELLKRRFLHTTEAKWVSLSATEQKQYDNSIVFIKSSTEGVGYAIYTQGHTFYTDDVTADNLLAKLKAGYNISLEKVTDEDGVEKVQITATDTTYTLSTTAVDNGAKLTFAGSVNGEDGKPLSVNEFSIVGSGDAKVTVEGSTVTIDAAEYTGENAISVVANDKSEGDKVVKLVIDSNDKVLSQGTTGLKTTLTLNYDSTSNKVQLLGNTVGEGEAASNLISEFDASAFVKDSFLESAAFVTLTDGEVEGKAAGEYLKLVFKTVDTDTTPETVNSTETVYLPVSDLVKTGTMDFKGETTKEFTFDATVGKYVDGANLATALNKLDADLDATLAEGTTKDANEVVVVTGLTQTNGLITSVDSAVVVNKTYVDDAIINAEGALSLENGENASYVFGIKNGENEDQDGYVNASEVAAILNAAWAWGEIK